MSSEEDQDVFEITDFTTATDWERFIARLEEVIHEWKLPLQKPGSPLKKGELTHGKWEEQREEITFATFHFDMVRYFLKRDESNLEQDVFLQDDNEDEEEPVPSALTDMMSCENDFPPKAHCLVRWYGLRDFVVIHPCKSGEAIMTENRSKLLLSSVCIALNNTNCQIPVFVQLQQMRQKFYLGICEGGGVRTTFQMIHFHNTLPQYNHLAGLLSIFKSKLAYSVTDTPPINVAIRFTYVLQDWSPYSWPQPPPDIDELGEDITPSDLGKLPFGALEDPVLELHLSTTWPNLTEDVIVDSDIHSDLHPLHAPKWAVRLKTSDNPSCSMADYLKEFATLSKRRESIDQILGRSISELDNDENLSITQALDKVARPTRHMSIPNLSSFMSHSRSRFPDYNEDSFINEEILIKILQFIFPDSAPTPSGDQDSDEWKDSVTSTNEMHDNKKFAKLQEHIRSFKSAPPCSLTWRLALAMCLVNHSYGGLAAVAQLWQDFLLEMRHRWENNYTLPCLENGPPNLTCCLLHQKLQMLNCCIERKKAREWQQTIQSASWTENTEVESDIRSTSHGSESDDEEEYFECDDSPTQKQEDGNKRKSQAEGQLSCLGNLKLLHSNKPLYVPITQEPAPVTEDLLKEQTDVLVQLGTNPEGAALRAKMQSACLLSDMEAFKAANPGSVLEDFVRWYSPRDWIEEEVIEEETGKKVIKGHLSARMKLPGNMWVEAWETARPVPARRQKRLFDDTKEAEKVLHFLASMRPGEVVTHLMPIVIHCALLQLSENDECPRSLPIKLEEAAIKAIKIMRSTDTKYDEVLNCLYQAEIILAQLHSLHSKLGLIPVDEDNQKKLHPSCNAEDSIGKHMKPTKFGQGLVGDAELQQFALDLLDNFEVEVLGASKGVIGKRIRQLFAEVQRATHLIVDDKPLASSLSSATVGHHSTVSEFPSPSGREFILRTTVPQPAPYSTPSSQRMYCVLTSEEFRIVGAFSEDTVFQ